MAAPTVNATLDDTTPDEDAPMRLTVNYGDPDNRTVVHSDTVTESGDVACKVQYDPVTLAVTDSDADTDWTEVSDTGLRAVFTATANKSGKVTIIATDTLGENQTVDTVSYTVNPFVPPPEPVPVGMPPLIGSSSKSTDWNTRKAMLEATGGKLEARRLFSGSLSWSIGAEMNECISQNTVPVISFKPGDWSNITAGGSVSSLKAIADKIVAFNRPCYLAFHHEPQQQSAGVFVGEGGTAQEFAAMQAYLSDYFKPKCPKMKFGVIMNGWIFSGQARGHSDAELNVWLPPSTRSRLDFIAADHYAGKNESEASVDRFKRQVAWMKRVSFPGSASIGETNGWIPSDLNDMFGYAKTEIQCKNGFILLWNSTVPNAGPDDWRPVHETGLLDEFQAILKNWR